MLTRSDRTVFLRPAVIVLAAVVLLAPAACVRRTVTFKTVPEGATVRLNDQDIGQTPVTVDFTWYGDYDITYEKEGYETLHTHRQIPAPWYQLPLIDLFAEALVPWTIHDHREIEQDLEPETLPTRAQLVPRAREFRDRALFAEE